MLLTLLTSTFALKAAPIEHGLKNQKRTAILYHAAMEINKASDIKVPLGNAASQNPEFLYLCSDGKLIFVMTFPKISNVLLGSPRFNVWSNSIQIWLVTLKVNSLTFNCKNSHTFISPTCIKSTFYY